VDALVHGRQPSVNVHAAIACTAPGIVAHQSALAGGTQMKIPTFDPPDDPARPALSAS
jgi:hypothetical protein